MDDLGGLVKYHWDSIRIEIDNIDEIKTWYEKAKKWDELYGQGICSFVRTDILLELQDKAEKYDYLDKCHPMITATEIDELKEKAKKWDDHLTVNASKGIFPNPLIEEWKEKAKKWDEYLQTHEKWEDVINKAKKWDLYGSHSATTERIQKLEDKAKKWDALPSLIKSDRLKSDWLNDVPYKAEKWDKLNEFSPEFKEIQLNWNIGMVSNIIKEWKDKAAKWDEYQAAPFNERWDTFKKLEEKAKKWDELIKYATRDRALDPY